MRKLSKIFRNHFPMQNLSLLREMNILILTALIKAPGPPQVEGAAKIK